MLPEELYRVGSTSSPKLDRIRIPRDVSFNQTYQSDGLTWIRPGKHGVSLFTLKGIKEKMAFFDPADTVWQLPKVVNLPITLGITSDHGEHYLIYPLQNMPLDEFKGEVAKIARQANAYLKVRDLSNV